MPKSPFCSLFQVTGAPHLLWEKIFVRASGDQKGCSSLKKKKKDKWVERCRSSLLSGCGGEGSWHRDLMHKKKQKSHCQGFPLLHSPAGDPVPSSYVHCKGWVFGCTILYTQFPTLDVAMKVNPYKLKKLHRNMNRLRRLDKIYPWKLIRKRFQGFSLKNEASVNAQRRYLNYPLSPPPTLMHQEVARV